ncbi:MAG: glycerol-3-phosphate 1-O-acyltransferase PlsY [Thermaerobacter sp.]|nr:glycerol-3-phosphate 1-O-acyltransferase PlsY [Thermaerobacter sp.]
MWLLSPAIGYLLGSVPFGVLASRFAGRDILKEGSGNPGATNALRLLGPGWAAAVLLGDALKAVLAAYIGLRLGGVLGSALGGSLAAVGHAYSVFLRGRGGKVVAVSLGLLAFWDWRVLIPAVVVFLIVVALTRLVALGSLVGALAAAVAASIWPLPVAVRISIYFLFLLIVWRHRPNIARIAKGQEHRLGQRG